MSGDGIRVDVACECTRIGYALFLCQIHAPIPYTLTEKGHRDARRHGENMKQWDAIKDGLVLSEQARRAGLREARAAGRRIEARVRRFQNGGK